MKTKNQHRLSVCLRGLSCLTLLALVLSPTQSKADTVFTSLSSYNAATNSNITITFNGIAPTDGFVAESSPFTLSGRSFSSTSSMFIVDPGFYASPYTGGGFLTTDFVNPDVLTITLPSVTAVAFDFGALFPGSASVLVSLSDGFTTTISTNDSLVGGSLAFAGFTSTAPLTSIKLTLPDSPDYNAIDNFTWGKANSPVPEPASLGLMLTGLLGAAGAIRRRLNR